MKLKNSTKRMMILTLPHAEVCSEEKCFCIPVDHLQTAHDGRTGAVGVRQIQMHVPVSLHIPAGAETEELPDAFANARAVRAAQKSNGLLRKVI